MYKRQGPYCRTFPRYGCMAGKCADTDRRGKSYYFHGNPVSYTHLDVYKRQVLALGIAHSTEAAQAQRQVTDLTNELLKKNAEALHLASTETAKESERGIVDIETLKQTNQELIATLDDVMNIQKEGRAKRAQAELEMRKMEEDLKNKLLEIQH